MSDNNNIQEITDHISLKDLILKIKDFWREVWRSKWWILLTIIIFVTISFLRVYFEKPSYKAQLTFMVDNDDGGGMNGLGSILGSFGLGGGPGKSNLDKILRLSQTRNISQTAFFNEMEVNGVKDYFANHIINYRVDQGEWVKKSPLFFWKKDSDLKNFRFSHDSISTFSILENQALKIIHKITVGSKTGLIQTSYEDNTGIMSIEASSFDPEISFHLTTELFKALSNYYLEKSVEKQYFTYNLIKNKKDSIEIELRANEYALAALRDSERNLFRSKDKLQEMRLEGKIRIGYAALAKSIENLELADFAVKNNTPFIQVIDEPIRPLAGIKSSYLNAIIISLVLGFIVALFFILARMIYKETMKE